MTKQINIDNGSSDSIYPRFLSVRHKNTRFTYLLLGIT